METEFTLRWVLLKARVLNHEGRSGNEEGDGGIHLLRLSAYSAIFGTLKRPCYKLSFSMVYGVTLASEKPGGQWKGSSEACGAVAGRGVGGAMHQASLDGGVPSSPRSPEP